MLNKYADCWLRCKWNCTCIKNLFCFLLCRWKAIQHCILRRNIIKVLLVTVHNRTKWTIVLKSDLTQFLLTSVFIYDDMWSNLFAFINSFINSYMTLVSAKPPFKQNFCITFWTIRRQSWVHKVHTFYFIVQLFWNSKVCLKIYRHIS